jgi:hypothetical protein
MLAYIAIGEYQKAISAADGLISIEEKRNSNAFIRSATVHKMFSYASLKRKDEFYALYDPSNKNSRIWIKGRDWTFGEIEGLLNS